jgi:DNA-binding IscR family transcriptional regulator
MSEEHFKVRDRRGGRRLYIHNAVIDAFGPLVGAYGVAVYAVLCRFASETDETAWPSVGTIAGRLRLSQNTVRQALTDLERHGLIGIERRKREGGNLNLTSVYTLLDVPDITDKGTSRGEVPHVVKEGTSCGEVQVLHVVKEGTSPREDEQDSYNKTQANKTKEQGEGPSAQKQEASTPDAENAWDTVKEWLVVSTVEPTFRAFIAPTKAASFKDGTLTLIAPTSHARARLDGALRRDIERAARQALKTPVHIAVITGDTNGRPQV